MKPAICFGKASRKFHYSAPEGLLFWSSLYESLVLVVFSAGVYRCHSMLRCSLMQTGDLVGTLIVIFSSMVLVVSIFLKMECPWAHSLRNLAQQCSLLVFPFSAQEEFDELVAGFQIEDWSMIDTALGRNSLLRVCFLSLYIGKSMQYNKKLLPFCSILSILELKTSSRKNIPHTKGTWFFFSLIFFLFFQTHIA